MYAWDWLFISSLAWSGVSILHICLLLVIYKQPSLVRCEYSTCMLGLVIYKQLSLVRCEYSTCMLGTGYL